MGKLTSTVTPQGIVGVVAASSTSGSTRCQPTGASRCSTRCAIPGTPARSCGRPTPRAPTAWCSPRARSTSYNPKTVRRRRGRCSTCRRARRPTDGRRSSASRARASDPRDGRDGARTSTTVDLQRPSRSCSATRRTACPTRSLAHGRREGSGAARGRAESLNLAAAATVCLFEWARRRHGSTRRLRDDRRRGGARHPLAAHRDEGIRLRAREAMGRHDRRAAGPDASGIVYDADRMDAILRLLVDAAPGRGGQPRAVPGARGPRGVRPAGSSASVARDPEHPERSLGRRSGHRRHRPRSREERHPARFIEAQVWWAREGPITIEAERVGDRLHLTVWRDGHGTHHRGRREALPATPARHRRREQDRPVRRAGRRRDAGRSRMGGGARRTAVVPPRDAAPSGGLTRAAC